MKRCPQCWKVQSARSFVTDRGRVVTWCALCRARRTANGYERAPVRQGLRKRGTIRVTFNPRSGNRKTGPIPVSISSAETCPPSCKFYGDGCYAEFHMLKRHWANVPENGLTWNQFLDKVRALPPGTLWRHNEAGDLPGIGIRLALDKFYRLILANQGRRGFTFTHKPILACDTVTHAAIHFANESGFVVNLSADSLDQADWLAERRIAPVAVVVPTDFPLHGTTPHGRPVVICPAETKGLTCEDCQLCAYAKRKAIVGFRAHGQMKTRVDKLVQLRTRKGISC